MGRLEKGIGNNYAHFQVSFRTLVEFRAINILTKIITRNIPLYYTILLDVYTYIPTRRSFLFL